MYMLTTYYNVKSGKYITKKDDYNHFVIVNSNKLNVKDKLNLRQFVIKHKLPVTFNEKETLSLTDENDVLNIISKLKYFRKNIMSPTPKFRDKLFSWMIILLMFLIPIYVAYFLSDFIQSNWIYPIINHLKNDTLDWNHFFETILFDSYGLISLGSYSIVWALPVVVFIGVSTAIINQSNIKSYIVWSIDPTMQHIGLTGYDIVPVIEGFGCNAAAVVNAANNCNSCSKQNCVSLISFGSSCSYQIGATASLFSVMHLPWLFIPYILIVFIGGLIHTKLWNTKTFLPTFYFNLESLQMPKLKQTLLQVYEVVKMFLLQALPIFFVICLGASLLSMTTIMTSATNIFNILLEWLNVPNNMSSGILFSMIRKDGMLLFNIDNGEVLRSISIESAFLLILFSSTFTPCSVTITMIIKKLGIVKGLKIVGKQMITAIICLLISIIALKLI